MNDTITDTKKLLIQSQVIKHMRGTILTIKDDCNKSLDYCKKNHYPESKTMTKLLKIADDEDKYLLRMSFKLDGLGNIPRGQKRLGETEKLGDGQVKSGD